MISEIRVIAFGIVRCQTVVIKVWKSIPKSEIQMTQFDNCYVNLVKNDSKLVDFKLRDH